MPSFVDDDDSSRIDPNTADILNLDPNNTFGLANDDKGKVNGHYFRQVHPASPIHEAFDESSTTSTHDSEFSDATPMPTNGQVAHDVSIASSTMEDAGPRSRSNSTRQAVNHDGVNKNASMPNGSATMTLPDRTASLRQTAAYTNGNGDDGDDASRDGESVPRTSIDSRHHINPVSSSGRQSPADGHHRAPRRSTEGAQQAPLLATIPSENEDDQQKPRIPPLTPASMNLESAQHRPSPHRLSSPPVYQAGLTTSSTSSSGHLQPPPPGAALKQRHTLEVPKAASGRLSKDGLDTAQASGRFSPTVAGMGPRRASLSLARRTTRSMQSDYPRDEVAPDEDAKRWAEALRQKRASKRRRKEEEDDDRVLVGTKVDESHANWVTAYNMLTGIRVSVSRTNAKLDRELTDADFGAKQKSTFDIAGNELVPSAKYDFKFKDYAPWVFRRLRSLFRLDPADYLMSLTGKYILSELGSPGKSGSFFYFSRDYKYIIKTIHHAEHKFLRKILKDYYTHVENNPNTLLSQFYGLHRVKMPYGKKIHFVVMNNLFPPHRDIHTTFDLKGSTVGRDYREEELDKNPRATLKDLNWLRRQRHLELGIQKKKLFLEQLQRDVVLLKRLQIMDYSLLVGVHDISRGNEENLRGKTLQVFNPGGEKPSENEPSALLRTPSKLESARKARELREMIRQERPVPMGQSIDKMPNELGESHSRPGFVFNQDDGGFQATHEDNSPADEVYYLGVIDCLTHYGIIKKIEHFWKGLSNDRTQISALPPTQYGDRFYNFVEGVTMSPEAAAEENRQREREDQAAAASARRKALHHIPPMPDHQPPAPPVMRQSPEGKQTIDMATEQARRMGSQSLPERQIPDRTLKTAVPTDQRDSGQHEPILPVVEEDRGEQGRDEAEYRPRTPAKDKHPPPTRAPPPTPPKNGTLPTPESSDSGYAGTGSNGEVSRDNSLKVQSRVSRESLNKSLPPLPK